MTLEPLRCRSLSPGRCALAVTAFLVALTAAVPGSVAAQTDHFTCYKARPTGGAAKFVSVPDVNVVDTFRASTILVRRPKLVCAPTDKNGEDAGAPDHIDHLEDYLIKPSARFVPVPNQKVVDQFGTLFVDVRSPVTLQVPTRKSLSGPPPTPGNPALDHFTCYKVRRSKVTPRFAPRIVDLEDQFGSMTAEVRKPKRLCAPTNKNDEEPGAEEHGDHLLCYQIKQRSVPRFAPVPGLFLNNQFGQTRLDAKKPAELCVPAQLNPGPTTPTPTPTISPTPTPVRRCGNGVVDSDAPVEQCDPAAPAGPPAICHPSQCVPAGATVDEAFACTCATGQIRTIFVEGRLDVGWTGTSHDLPSTAFTDFDALLFDCDGVIDPECRMSGPRPGKYGFRCELNSRIVCSTNTDCAPLNGRCGGFLGPPLAISSGGVPVCATNFFPRPLTGTFNVADGTNASFTFILSKAHTGQAIDAPCPRCNCSVPPCGVEPPNNVGTCSGGPSAGQPCTVEGLSPFGPMSRDCPPLANANVSGEGLDVRFLPATSGVSTLDVSLPCTASGNSQFLCPCDTCGGGPTSGAPCQTNADCGTGGVCGALRCLSGQNNGQLCASAADCVGGTCTRPGTATKPNDCEFGCQGGDTPDVPCATNVDCGGAPCLPLCRQLPALQTGKGECVIGPTEGKCSMEPFRSCAVDAECNAPTCAPPGACPGCTLCGQTCSFNQRPCHVFPMAFEGEANPFTVDEGNGKLVTTLCVPTTTSEAVNTTGGLPGEGAVIVPTTYTKRFPADVCGLTCP